jgi:GDP-4-dehydro-6-deoxy-D-mannose reductase
MITRALVTGASGFVGGHLAAHLAELGVDVVGSARGERPRGWLGDWRQLDVRDGAEAEKVIAEVQPDVVFHLAGVDRNAALADLFDVYAVATQRLLAAVSRAGAGTRIVIAGSSAEYGFAPASELPIDEQGALRPLTPYGVSKCAQTLLALAAARAGADVVVTRTFNLVGPGEPATLVCGAFASQIAAREAGVEHGPLAVGNLESERDFLDVRDAVRAYALAAVNGSAGEIYNVCSGTATRVSDVLRMLVAGARTAIDVPPSPSAMPADVPAQVGDPSRLRAATGWTPAFTLEQSLEALLESQRAALKGMEATGTLGR